MDAPGWRKLRSHAHHPHEILMKEKALLFKDYIQPYNFTSNDNNKLPETSRESLFGSTAVSSAYPEGPASKSTTDDPYTKSPVPPVKKRNYEPPQAGRPVAKPRNVRLMHAVPRGLNGTDGSPESSPETIHREPAKNKKTYFNDGVSPINDDVPDSSVMPNNVTGPTNSMDWDPFIESGKNKKGGNKMIPRRRRNISPISEGDEEENVKPATSLEVHAGSELPGSPEYSETSSYVDSAPSTYKMPSSPSSESATTIRSDEYSTTSDDGSLPTTTETTTRTQTSDDTTGWIPPRREYDRRRNDKN